MEKVYSKVKAERLNDMAWRFDEGFWLLNKLYEKKEKIKEAYRSGDYFLKSLRLEEYKYLRARFNEFKDIRKA